MTKLKAAILEDNKTLLKDLKQNLEATNLVEVIAWATNSEEFIEKAEKNQPEALILDIDLQGDSMTGIDIANRFKLPTLFVSGKNKEYLEGIESLTMNSEYPVLHISKPITKDKLDRILPKLIQETQLLLSTKFTRLDFSESKRNKVNINTIVFLCTDKNHGSKSNNKVIYFNDRKPEILINFSFSKMNNFGLSERQFITISGSHRVNVEHIIEYTPDHKVIVQITDKENTTKKVMLPVSENYRKKVRQI
ncbi:MAG: response regulator [Salinivirgaceae bacterium]|nr:response regulator [Salinivirgaceae bacterium]